MLIKSFEGRILLYIWSTDDKYIISIQYMYWLKSNTLNAIIGKHVFCSSINRVYVHTNTCYTLKYITHILTSSREFMVQWFGDGWRPRMTHKCVKHDLTISSIWLNCKPTNIHACSSRHGFGKFHVKCANVQGIWTILYSIVEWGRLVPHHLPYRA